ncbi:MAG TPA: acyl-CoA dehydrogenase family protein [Stellaceae bacterium]|nr:acyl-CoA dehydrogenase family protein [Stellaceae bacterium]
MDDSIGPDFVARARALAPSIEASADEIERGRRLTQSIVSALVEGGFYRMLLPRSLGGAELTPMLFMQVLEEIAKADASVAWCLGQCGVCATVAAYLDPDVARTIFGAASGILAWGPTTSSAAPARIVDGGYRVTGRWSFASGCRQASWLGCHVRLVAADGSMRLRPDGSPAVRTLLFPAERAILHDVWHVIGLRGTGTDSYSVDDLFVPAGYSLARDDHAECRETGPLYRLSASNIFSMGFGAVALGVARAMLDATIDAARGKQSYGIKHAMREDHFVQSQIGRCEGRLRAARAYLFACVDELWRSLGEAPALTDEQRVALRLASTWTIHQAAEVVDIAYHMMGATAVFSANPFERRFRDIHTIAQQSQSRDVHYESVGQILLGLPPDATLFTS